MQDQKNERGKAIIIGVVIVLLVGLLSYAIWQNFSAKDTTDESAGSQENTTSQTTDSEGYVVLSDWGVKFKAPLDGTTIQWAKLSDDTSGGNAIGFMTSNLTPTDTCSPEKNAAGTIERSKNVISTETVGAMVSTVANGEEINGYYYAFILPNGQHCEDQSPNDQDEAARVNELLQTLKAV